MSLLMRLSLIHIYGYDDKGRLTGERQTVENPETGEMLWEHETGHAYSEQGLATRQEPDGLPPVEWLTYGLSLIHI